MFSAWFKITNFQNTNNNEKRTELTRTKQTGNK